MLKTAERKRKKLQGADLERFEKRLLETAPPKISRSENMVLFLKNIISMQRPSFGGFSGLDRTEIRHSLEGCDYLDIEWIDISWAVDRLENALRQYFNRKESNG